VNIPENVVTVPPKLYKQQYFLYKNDPFPGYEEWRSEEEEVVFIKRKISDYYFESMQEDISGTSSLEISSFLSPYIANPKTVLTVKMFDDMMIQQENNIKKNGMDKALGAGSGGGGLSSVLSQLLGQLSVTINLQAEAQLPGSVLNAQAVNKSMEAFSESMAIVNRVNQMMDQAFIIPNVIDDLANIGLSQLTNALNLNGVLENLNISGLNLDLNGLNFDIEGVNITVNTPVLSNAISRLQNVSSQLRGAISNIQNEFNQAPLIQAANRLEAIAATQRISIAIG
jgi:hypothetical protein